MSASGRVRPGWSTWHNAAGHAFGLTGLPPAAWPVIAAAVAAGTALAAAGRSQASADSCERSGNIGPESVRSKVDAAGMFGLFLEQNGPAGQFRFGGRPTAPGRTLGWEDLDL